MRIPCQLSQHDAIGIDIKKPEPPGNPGADIIQGDIKDYQLMMSQTKDVDVVIHTAAQVSVDRSLTDPVFDAQCFDEFFKFR